ncbi:DNA cytosine methyltransferase [Knoellia sp. LjRoot47]|uniref:DNA cytosine methyltransferase n=1 Tax=Knoellia sp. LjRoot47 TaxID=3342330 RepID=UPI003ECF4AAB
MAFSYIDLFAGIGGFHAAMGAMGGQCWMASEIDLAASRVYEHNWGGKVKGDIVPLTESRMDVPPHDVLAAGFPCQPFSKSGYQRGMDEARGTLFWNIARIIEERQPTVVLLENVRNLAGPRHAHEWEVIIKTLRQLGYRVSERSQVFSPHLLPPALGGRPQVRERVFITATYVGVDAAKQDVEPLVTPTAVEGWDPQSWDLAKHLPLQDDDEIENLDAYRLTDAEAEWVQVWDEFIDVIVDRLDGGRLPGFPIWADHFVSPSDLDIAPGTPAWKANFLRKNAAFYEQHREVLNAWLPKIQNFPPSRRKFEWQAQDPTSLTDTVMHFRPSGIRAKRPTYVPALVAITQTSIVGSRGRRITPREAARLQGLPDWFEFKQAIPEGEPVLQADPASYKQMGNGVNVGAAYYVLRQHVLRDIEVIGDRAPELAEAVLAAPENPDDALVTPLEASPLPVGPERSSGGPVSAAVRKPQTASV